MKQVLLAHAYLLDYSVRDGRGKTLLHHLAWSSKTSREIFEGVSARSGHTNNILDGEQRSVLHHAAQRGNIAVVEYILAHLDLNVNSKDKVGRTPLHYAIESSRASTTIGLLVSNGAEISAQDDKGWSALHLAANRDKEAAVQAFVDTGLSSELLMEDYCGQTPIQIAEKKKAQNVLPMLSRATELRLREWRVSNLDSGLGKAAPKTEINLEEYIEKKKANFPILRRYISERLSQRTVLAAMKALRKALRLFSCAVLLCGIWLIFCGK